MSMPIDNTLLTIPSDNVQKLFKSLANNYDEKKMNTIDQKTVKECLRNFQQAKDLKDYGSPEGLPKITKPTLQLLMSDKPCQKTIIKHLKETDSFTLGEIKLYCEMYKTAFSEYKSRAGFKSKILPKSNLEKIKSLIEEKVIVGSVKKGNLFEKVDSEKDINAKIKVLQDLLADVKNLHKEITLQLTNSESQKTYDLNENQLRELKSQIEEQAMISISPRNALFAYRVTDPLKEVFTFTPKQEKELKLKANYLMAKNLLSMKDFGNKDDIGECKRIYKIVSGTETAHENTDMNSEHKEEIKLLIEKKALTNPELKSAISNNS